MDRQLKKSNIFWFSLCFILSMLLGGISVFAAENDFTIDASFNMKELEANKNLNVRVNIQNNTNQNQNVLSIVALYDANNQLVNIGETTGEIKKGKSKSLPVKLTLPKDITNHHVKVFALKGTNWASSDQVPQSNIAILEGKEVPIEGIPNEVSIITSEQGDHIFKITNDAIYITSGDTFIYTVDTAEGAGRTTLTIRTVGELFNQISSKSDNLQTYVVKGEDGAEKRLSDTIADGDILTVSAGDKSHDYTINLIKGAVRGKMELINSEITANTPTDVVLNFFAGMRSPATEVVLKVPKGINATMNNTKVNVIGRGEVFLSGLETQSIGRVGAGYRFDKVGTVKIDNQADGSQLITFKGLDFRPANGADLQITFENVKMDKGTYEFEASYTTSEPEVLKSPSSKISLDVVGTISNFHRVLEKNLTYKETSDTYLKARFDWSPAKNAKFIKMMQSIDKGATWTESPVSVNQKGKSIEISNLTPNTEYYFKLVVTGGDNAGDSNIAKFYTGKYDAKLMGAKGDGKADDTDAINKAILYLNSLGGGTLLFENGTFNVRTVHLQSNVYLYIHENATIAALRGGDAPETTYFSDRGYRSGTSATDTGPYRDPENYLTKQDVGHTFFRNSMFFGERIDNFKIIGNGRITGNNNLVTGDGVMNNAPDNRTDKMVTIKLSTNFEFGGLDKGMDLWYEETNSPTTDEPYYIMGKDENGNELRDTNISNMLKVDRAGHFALLATGSEYINTHDFYYDKGSGGGARDVFDYMQSSYVYATNIYAKGVSDDIVKPGSDSSLGFTKPATTYFVRNIIGDTNCNLFQIGSETVDDIKNLFVDNIYVLAGNKAGFSISTNDGGHIENIWLNHGKTGPVRDMSEMRRTRAPFFISISNRGRVIGGKAERMKFMENGVMRDELLSTNVNIGHVRNIYIKDVNIKEVYQGSQYSNPANRWVPYTSQNKATPIIAGYKVGEGGPTLPDGRNIGYIENLHFENVDVLVKGGNGFADSEISPPELGVGKYNIGDIGEQPSYGFWARHVDGLHFKDVTVNFEKNDDRYAFVLDDVKNATLDNVTMVKGKGNRNVIQLKNADNITVKNSTYYQNTWGNELTPLADIKNVSIKGKQTYPFNMSDSTTIKKSENSTHIFEVDNTKHTIDVQFGTTVEQIKEEVISEDGSRQSYSVVNAQGDIKASGRLVSSDLLVVTAESAAATQEYKITVAESANVNILLKPDDSKVIGLNNTARTVNVITGTTVNELLTQIQSEDNSVQSYQVLHEGTPIKDGTMLTDGDILQVTAENGNDSANFTINVGEDVRIKVKEDHPNISGITRDTVRVLNGATVKQLLAQIQPLISGNDLEYEVTESNGISKTTGELVEGDWLIVSKNRTSMPYHIITSNAGATSIKIEGETGRYVLGGAMTTKTNNESSASGGANREFNGGTVGDYVDYIIPNVPAGKYTLKYTYKSNTNGRGIVQVSVNGTDVGGSIDEHGPSAYHTVDMSDVYVPSTGDAIVRSTIIGKNPASSVYTIIVDSIELVGVASGNTNIKSETFTIDNDGKTLSVNGFTKVEDVLGAITSTDGSTQSYQVKDVNDLVKESGFIAPTDQLIVSSANGRYTTQYVFIGASTVSNNTTIVSTKNNYIVSINTLLNEIKLYNDTTVAQLMESIESFDGSAQTYVVTDQDEELKASNDVLQTGDQLIVTAADGKTKNSYIIDASTAPEFNVMINKDSEFIRMIDKYRVDGKDRSFVVMEPGIKVADLRTEMISANSIPVDYVVYRSEDKSVENIVSDDDLIYDGDIIEFFNQNDPSNKIEMTASVFTEYKFAYQRTNGLNPNVTYSTNSGATSSDDIAYANGPRYPYLQTANGSGALNGWVAIKTKIETAGKYKFDVVYKDGNRGDTELYLGSIAPENKIGDRLASGTPSVPRYLVNYIDENLGITTGHKLSIKTMDTLILDEDDHTFIFSILANRSNHQIVLESIQLRFVEETE
ncbi:hypothetical protein V7147_20625 [Bacillus sp. JJ1521]|uniref:hypothetical protein n=1 Tax=Bacillus sp. JJ1521 TaxID=3122957 RepID=UPI002FFFE93F